MDFIATQIFFSPSRNYFKYIHKKLPFLTEPASNDLHIFPKSRKVMPLHWLEQKCYFKWSPSKNKPDIDLQKAVIAV